MIRILALVAETRMPNNDVMYQHMQQYANVDVIKVSSIEQKKLGRFLKKLDVNNYDRILMDLHFKRIVKQVREIKKLQNLTIYEEDACQNYIKQSKWKGQFLKFYKKIGRFRLICTSATVTERFKKEGIDAHFVAKGYDESFLKNINLERDIELGFIGRVSSDVYMERYRILTFFQHRKKLLLLRTNQGEDYLKMLNRIKIFISADVGFNEYMIKNFEAMACGCLLVAYNQGVEENALGFQDMVNVVLYKDKQELLNKLNELEKTPGLIMKISAAGQSLAEERFTYFRVAAELFGLLGKEFVQEEKRRNVFLKWVDKW